MSFSQDYLNHIKNLAVFFKTNTKVPNGMKTIVEKFIKATEKIDGLHEKQVVYLYEIGNKLRQNWIKGTPSWMLEQYLTPLDAIINTELVESVGEEVTNADIAIGDEVQGEELDAEDIRPDDGTTDDEIFICAFDEEEFTDVEDLMAHMKENHPDVFKDIEEEVKEGIQTIDLDEFIGDFIEEKCQEAGVDEISDEELIEGLSDIAAKMHERGYKMVDGKWVRKTAAERVEDRKKEAVRQRQEKIAKFKSTYRQKGSKAQQRQRQIRRLRRKIVAGKLVKRYEDVQSPLTVNLEETIAGILLYCKINEQAVDKLVFKGEEISAELGFPEDFYEENADWVNAFEEAYCGKEESEEIDEAKKKSKKNSPGRTKMIRLLFALGVLSKKGNKVKFSKEAAQKSAKKISKIVGGWTRGKGVSKQGEKVL